RVDNDPVANDRHLAAAHDTRGQQAELVDLAVDDERMARVMAALKAHDHIGALGQPVNNLALALVTPLGTNHRHVSHNNLSLKIVVNQESFVTPSGVRYCPHWSRRASAAISVSAARPATVFHPSCRSLSAALRSKPNGT